MATILVKTIKSRGQRGSGDDQMSDLGNLSDFFKEGSGAGPNNLDWLEVNDQQYRELDTLPKQNLDITPDLKAVWRNEDWRQGKSSGAYLVPNKDTGGYTSSAPKDMGDLTASVIHTARLALMQSSDPRRWQETMLSRFDRDVLLRNKTALASVLAERGLLGSYYVDASDFPGCDGSRSKTALRFVKKVASGATYLRAKKACGDCSHRTHMGKTHHCSVFHKQLVTEVPYTEELADQVEAAQKARGFQASQGIDPKARIRNAYLAPIASKQPFSGQDNVGGVIPADRLFRKSANVQSQQETLQASKARPIVDLLRRELLKGRSAAEIATGLRLSFDIGDLKATQQYWLPLYKEAGLYGTVYSTQDSFGDCREGASFLSKHGSSVRAIVAGAKCDSCIYSKVGRCLMYGKKLIAKADDIYTKETVAAVLDEHKMAGSLSPHLVGQHWGATPKESLQNIHKEASGSDITRIAPIRLDVQRTFHGASRAQTTSDLTRRTVVKQASKFLNEGLYGEDLQTALRGQFDPRDLKAAEEDLKKVLAEEGLQGIYFVDPTVYDDYGKGCKEAARLHRSRNSIKYAKVGNKCDSCVHQTKIGYCSVLNKSLAIEPPYTNKQAQREAVLASGQATEVNFEGLVNNGLTMMQEFELTGGSGHVDLNPSGFTLESSIQFGNNDVDLTKL